MPELRRGFSENYGYLSDSGIRARRTAQSYRNYGYSDGGGIEFRPVKEEEDESGPPSPTLWSTSPSRIPEAEASLLHHASLSPVSRKNAIAKGRKEIMEMLRNVPETSYDLSLRDLVEKSHVQISTDKKSNDPNMQSEKGKRKKSQERINRQMGRSISMESEPVLLKMFFPSSLGLKKKSLSMGTGTGSRTPPRSPKLEPQEKSIDKEWWKKRYSFAGDSDTVVKSSNKIGSIGSSGSSSSGSSGRRRSKIGRLAGCWSCFQCKDKTL